MNDDVSHFGSLLPSLRTPPPGPTSRALMARLASVESRNVTFSSDAWPVFWDEARGSNVRDVDGNVFIDLTAAFGVALLGHAHPAVVSAIEAQAGRLMHGMGDVHPSPPRLELMERLSALSPWEDTRVVLASTGSEAVEIALKTAQMATGNPGILAFNGGYHGLTLGSLAATERQLFRDPFLDRLYGGVTFAPFPDDSPYGTAADGALEVVKNALAVGGPDGEPIGAVIVEPVQGRAGVRLAPHGFMAALSRVVAESDAVLIADEILTGMGRCGANLASERVGLLPDLVCVGKALGGGMPISACLGSAEVMNGWPLSEGEAIHTSTFMGHPVACSAALAVLDSINNEAVIERARVLGAQILKTLRARLDREPGVVEARGLGLLIGVEFVEDGRAARLAEAALRAGLLVLPAGDRGHVLELAPPVELSDPQAEFAIETLTRLIREVR